jgi:DNA-binding response OmpR family regulator
MTELTLRVLIVEDDPMIAESMQDGLTGEHYAVDLVLSGSEADLALYAQDYDLVLLDLGLPGRSGLEVLETFRRRGGTTPILIVTARDATADRVAGLDLGADDYLIKPFHLDELFARIRALLRRSSGRASPIVVHNGLTLDPATHEVTFHGTPVNLSGREFALLQVLLSPPGIVVSRPQLEERLYGEREEIGSNAVEVHIHSLRKKLNQDFIRNVRGVGYKVGGTA